MKKYPSETLQAKLWRRWCSIIKEKQALDKIYQPVSPPQHHGTYLVLSLSEKLDLKISIIQWFGIRA
jgi:hypothetical protein